MKSAKEYIFDRDDNTLHMDTSMYFEKMQKNQKRDRVEVKPEQFRDIEHLTWADDDVEYRWINWDAQESYVNFRKDLEFVKDTRIALINQLYWPAYDKIIKAIKSASSWYICTSRWHNSEALKMWKRMIIDSEKGIHNDFLQSVNIKSWSSMNIIEAIEFYLNTSKDYAVNWKEFADKHNGGVIPWSAPWKIIAVKDMLRFIKNKYHDDVLISVWFSDDNKRLVDAVAWYLTNEAKHDKDFWNMHFVTYLTEDSNNIIKNCITRKQDIIDTLIKKL